MTPPAPSHSEPAQLRTALDRDLRRLRDTVITMGGLAALAIARAAWAFTERNPDLATMVIEEDPRLNELQREVHELSHSVIVTQSPVARDLREIFGLLHMSSELERMGDHAVGVAGIARTLADLAPLEHDTGVDRIADLCGRQLREVLDAVMSRDVDAARRVAGRDDQVDGMYRRMLSELVELMARDGDTAFRATHVIFIAHHLERIGDRVINIAEELVFQETGGIEDLG